jgi:hypothetical protein
MALESTLKPDINPNSKGHDIWIAFNRLAIFSTPNGPGQTSQFKPQIINPGDMAQSEPCFVAPDRNHGHARFHACVHDRVFADLY